MAKAFLTRQDFNECAEVLDADDTALVNATNFNLSGKLINHSLGGVSCGCIKAADDDGAIILDLNGCACVFLNALDGLATRSNNHPDLLGWDLDAQKSWGVSADV
jgi:hypothetical protein